MGPGFFDKCTPANCTNPFQLFGAAELAALGCLVIFIVLLCVWGRRANERSRMIAQRTIAVVLVINELGWHIWNIATGQWNLQTMLPLHLCSAAVWLGAYMLWFKAYWFYEFAYLLGIAGALQALLTPDLGLYNFPHYRYFQTYISHGLLVAAPIYLTVVQGLRPRWRSLLRVGLWANVYMAVVFVVNLLVDGNYMFVAHKPATASLLDMLPPWPVYILFVELIGLVCMLILYSPFALRDAVKKNFK